MKNIQIATIIKQLCKSKNITVKFLLEQCNINKGFMYELEKRGKVPSIDKLELIADYLNVSVDYLLGRTDIENSNIATPNSPTVPTLELNENESELLRIYRSLSVRSKNELMTAAYDIEDKKSST